MTVQPSSPTDSFDDFSEVHASSRESDSWWLITAKVVATLVTAGLGGIFVATASMGLVPAICLGVAATLLSGLGGYFAVDLCVPLILQERDFEWHDLVWLVACVVGIVVGFFSGGGALAAAVGAFALGGTAAGCLVVGFAISQCCFPSTSS